MPIVNDYFLRVDFSFFYCFCHFCYIVLFEVEVKTKITFKNQNITKN